MTPNSEELAAHIDISHAEATEELGPGILNGLIYEHNKRGPRLIARSDFEQLKRDFSKDLCDASFTRFGKVLLSRVGARVDGLDETQRRRER